MADAMTFRLLPFLGWAICIATLSAFMGQCALTASQPGVQGASLNYALEADGKLRIPIQNPKETLFLRAHLEIPESENVVENSTWTYGLRLTFHQPDGNFQGQDLWLRSRISPQEDGSPSLKGPNANRWITDGRLVELNLDGKIRSGGHLEVSPILSLAESRLVLRLERQPSKLQMRLPWEGGAILANRVSRYSALPWLALERLEIEEIWKDNRLAVAADQLNGKTVQLQRLHPANSSPDEWVPPTILAPGQATGITLQGPCTLLIASETANGDPVSPDWVPEIQPLSGNVKDGLVSQSRVEVPADSTWFVKWTAPSTGPGMSLTFEAEHHRACVWGQPGGLDWDKVLAPEQRRFSAWSTTVGQSLVVPVATGSKFGRLTIESRPRPPANWSPDQAISGPPEKRAIRYTLEDDFGTVISKGQSFTHFEHDALSVRIEPENGWMGALSRFTVQHPFQATRLRIETDSPMDFRFLVPLPVEEERAAIYALPAGWVAQNAPWELAPYVSLNPFDSDALLEENRLVRFDATVGPIQIKNRRPEGAQATKKLSPQQQTKTFPILEKVRKPGAWKAWHRTKLSQRTRLNIPTNGNLKVEYRTSSKDPGSFSLKCGEVEGQHDLPAAAGSFRLEGMPSGWQACTLSAPNGRYVVNVAGSGQRWAKRESYPLTETEMVVPIQVPRGGSSVFVRVYSEPGQSSPTLEVKIDNGKPRLRTGVVAHPTQPRRKVQPRKSVRGVHLLDSAQPRLQAHQGIMVVLGDDLKPGPHTVHVRVKQANGPVYVRFDSSAGLPTTAEPMLRNWYVDGETK
jgi:hypothetical protein